MCIIWNTVCIHPKFYVFFFFSNTCLFYLKIFVFIYKVICFLVLKHIHFSLWFGWQRNWNYAHIAICQNTNVVWKICIYCLSLSNLFPSDVYCVFLQTKLKEQKILKSILKETYFYLEMWLHLLHETNIQQLTKSRRK